MKLMSAIAAGFLLVTCAASAQDFGDTPYVQTPQNVVDKMLQIAHVGPADYVIDLGSGDGRMVITAAQKYGARGFGVDLDRRLVELANKRAASEGVADRAVFYERDLYETDMTAASVVTIYLLPEVNLMVRPKLLATLKPGTRIVAHDYDMGEWKPDEQLVLDAPDKPVGRDKKSKVFYWVVPANAAGKWRWEMQLAGKPAVFTVNIAQNFQTISGSVSVDGNSWPLENARLTGEEIQFTVHDARSKTRYEFSGHIAGQAITGAAKVAGINAQRQLEWDAARIEPGAPAHALLKKPTLQELQLVQ
ncbi:MAG TPA: class I SAM-dependent methyltransferase [Burkholderiales bacterium]|jgi:protein-L-isoaspartate O-methyltransferase|nr:class I SAM-dependent methyltransferase [Burkholderiales bacterium]